MLITNMSCLAERISTQMSATKMNPAKPAARPEVEAPAAASGSMALGELPKKVLKTDLGLSLP